jgi:phospholipid-binding lipoprotein MlaA
MMMNRLFLLVLFAILMGGCVASQQNVSSQNQADSAVDPYEGFNRTMFRFNDGLDRYFFKPVAKTYRFITPSFIEDGVSHFFSNLLDLRSSINAILQGKAAKSVHYSSRFLLNSTVGIGGLFDMANAIGIEQMDAEDFGQTLAVWGVESGPYLVIPFFGPSTIRDGVSIPVDMYTNPVTYFENSDVRFLSLVDTRTRLLETEKLLIGDRYIFIRDAYLQYRDYLVKDGEVDDTFGADIDDTF